ncbi:MAG: aminotransferase class III-fold pyridoxal phosphate-dependent enzyme [Clostridiales bacterium]|nr:aminotransferase class III-fold pyridoxal phosphate-dependent enzyme [Clostridiales bacterium]
MGKYYNSAEEIYQADKAYNMHSWSTQGAISPKVIEKAEGVFFWDSTGKKYYDMSSQLVNLNIGYGNKKVIEAMKEQAEKMAYIGPGFAMEERSALAQKIIEVAPDNMAKVFFTLGGAYYRSGFYQTAGNPADPGAQGHDSPLAAAAP